MTDTPWKWWVLGAAVALFLLSGFHCEFRLESKPSPTDDKHG